MTSESLIKKAKRFKIAKPFLVAGSFLISLGIVGAGIGLHIASKDLKKDALNEFQTSNEFQEQVMEDFNELKAKFDGNEVLANEYIESLDQEIKDDYLEESLMASDNAILKNKYTRAENMKNASTILQLCSIPAVIGTYASIFFVKEKEDKYGGILDYKDIVDDDYELDY